MKTEDTDDKQSFAIISPNFEKIWNDPCRKLRSPRETDSREKKIDADNLVSPLKICYND